MSLEEEEKGGLVQGVAVGYCYRGMLEWLPSLQNAVLRVLFPNFSATPLGIEAGGKRAFAHASHLSPHDSQLMQREPTDPSSSSETRLIHFAALCFA